ncbi:MAG: hypothetical protein OEO23_13355, partial [Gemmatimonadota bacterium]|nr:hypothetical protein [Gemmatimonadota bacterium]
MGARRRTPLQVLAVCSALSGCVGGERETEATHGETNTSRIERPVLFQSHEAGPEQRYGSWNPASPPWSREFDFLIGGFVCEDQWLRPDGSWTRSASEWSAAYVLNGSAIQDWYWNDRFAGTSIRTFDPAQDAWLVDFVGMPGVVTGRWVGQPEGTNMVMRQERRDPRGEPLVSRLTFFGITPTAFSWVGE